MNINTSQINDFNLNQIKKEMKKFKFKVIIYLFSITKKIKIV